MRGLMVLALVLSASPALAQSSAPASVPSRTTAADLLTADQLRQDDQALGWWLGGTGTVSMVAGGFALFIARGSPASPTRDLERATGLALTGLGAAFLVSGIFVMTGGDPGPCETDGTALSVSITVMPNGVGAVGRF